MNQNAKVTVTVSGAAWIMWIILIFLGLLASPAPETARAELNPVQFNRDIRTIFAEHCFTCHGPDDKQRKVGLRLDLRDTATARLRSGRTAIVPGRPDGSELLRRVASQDADMRMPPPMLDGPSSALSDEEVQRLRRWIANGAKYEGHWAFIPPHRDINPPMREGDTWSRNDIDRFVLSKLRERGLTPSGEAAKQTLIRRVSFDLTGLPPTIDELDAFLEDDSADAYEKVVDRLLASQAFGERMAVHWLDLARFADSDGYHDDTARSMWQFRDYVIQSFNKNKPFDQFTIEQLAGDQLADATLEQKIASAFNRLGPTSSEGGADAAEYAALYAMDRVNTTAAVWLGVTLECSQCHDHKYDPFSTKEYYQLFAFFNQVPEQPLYRGLYAPPSIATPTPQQEATLSELTAALDSAQAALDNALYQPQPAWDESQAIWEAQFVVTEPDGKDDKLDALREIAALQPAQRDDEQAKQLRAYFRVHHVDEVMALDAQLTDARKQRDAFDRSIPRLRIMATVDEPRPTHILMRGDFRSLGERVKPQTPAVLGELPDHQLPDRLALARWLVREDHPLTARVTVNRFWQMIFGTGIVNTAGDFGSRGEWPTHPELLDYLAVRFMDSGWDIKAMLKLMVMSAAYQQHSAVTPALLEADPHNRYLAHGPRRRLPAETIRDNALAISGLLDRARVPGGPSVKPYQPGDLWRDMSYGDSAGKSYVQSQGPDLYRRGLYTFWKRSVVYPAFAVFDAPMREVCTITRPITNTPLQAFVTLNDITYVEAARVLAESILKNGGDTFDDRLTFAWRRALARKPVAEEVKAMRMLYDAMHTLYADDPESATALVSTGESPRDETLDLADHAAWTAVCNAILNLDETLTSE